MKVPCKKCHREMQYPFRECKHCGWRPEGKLAERAKEFARKYEKEHGAEKRKAGGTGSVPRLVEPPPGKGSRGPGGSKPEIVPCPKCGKDIIIASDERPIKISCGSCGAKIKILN